MTLGQLLFNYIQARKLVFSATAALFEGVNLFVKRIIRAKRVDAAEVFYLFFTEVNRAIGNGFRPCVIC